MIIDELNKKIADIESLANDKTSTIESKVSDLTDGLLMVADAVDIIPEMVDEKITAITKEFSAIKDSVSKVKAQKGDNGRNGIDGLDGLNGTNGKDGSPDKPEQIVDKLNGLEGVLDTKVLKDFEMPNVKDLERQINTIGNQTLRLLSRPTTTTSSSFTGVTTDATLTGLGTDASPLSVVATSASDVAVTVRAATTAALAGTWTYNNGTAGVGATLTRTTNGALPNQDGVSLMDGDRFLIKNQASTLANGVYVLTQKGVTSVSPTIFTRATDADTTSQLDELVVTVSEGSTNRGTVWGQQTNNPVIGTSAITFATVVSTAVTQATAGTQVINQIPLYTGTARQLTRGTANFKYNPLTDTITIRGVNMLFPTANVAGPLTNNGSGTLSWGSFITEGAPTQADRASVDIQVLDTDYEALMGLQLTFGTSQQQVLEFYDSDSDPEPTAPIIGVDMGGGLYRSAGDTLVGPGSVPATLIDYSSLVGTFSEGEQVAEVFAYADYFGYDPYGDSVYYVYNSTANFQAGIVQNIDASESSSTGAFNQTVTLATIDYGTLTDTFVQYEGVDNGLGDTGKIFFDNGSNQMSILVGTGTFTVGQTLTGGDSGATCIITAISSFTGDEVSGAVSGTIGDSLYNYNSTLKEIITDNGTDQMYTTDNGTYTSGNTLLGLTSNATADIDSASNVNINYINDGDTVTIGGKTYTWQTTLTNVDGNVQLGSDDGESLQNLSDALQLTGTPVTQYAASMTANAFVSSSGGAGAGSLDVLALIPGTAGNSIAVSQSITSGLYNWNTPTLENGIDPTTNTIALIIRSAINHGGITGIASQNILADNKVLGRPIVITDDDTVTIYSIRPGTYGNGIAVDSTDTAVINPLTSTTTGGADNGTTGAVGSLRKGIVVTGAPIPTNGSQYSDCVFQAIDNNVWIIISSSTDTDGYDWYDF